jgi:Ca2+/H+ antiporter, TMEM165/GDT1 family
VRTIFEDIIIPFVTIALAELGDKTQVSILLLSSRTNKFSSIFLGVFFAFLIVDGIAIALGNLITSVVDITILKPISGVVFIIFGVYMLLSKKEETKQKNYEKSIFVSAFLMIFLTEWGDKTQVAAALFATQYNALFVLLGTMLALSLLSLLAIFFGTILNKKINQKLLKKVAGVVFIILGITCFIF